MENRLLNDYVFALDIGTRSVIGVVCRKEGNSLKILAESMLEHGCRSMIDGQVHDIEKVAQVVDKVKKELEGRLGFELKEAAIAAAGRTLKTECVHVEQEVDEEKDIDSNTINNLELYGVSEAGRLIRAKDKDSVDDFYCVGYSVKSYYLNGYAITNLLSQRGRTIGADVLATFLPQAVVSSLYRVLDKCGLSVISLTLEPIAAMEAVVPENVRLLNIALIDIGAGTSDIAITKRGTVVAYGMVPVAGDEVTEALADHYLIDFNTAEEIKRKASKKKKLSFKDVLGNKVLVESGEIQGILKDCAQKLGNDISGEILRYNGGEPRAVFLVGGGSQLPFLMESMAEKLKIDRQRIALKSTNSITELKCDEKYVSGPEGVTVIGIALIALKKAGHDFMEIYVNDREYRIFNSGALNICDVLGLINYDPSLLMARSGRNVRFTINGENRRVSGEDAVPPEIYINDIAVNLEAEVHKGDYIKIINARNGKDAAPVIHDYIKGMDMHGKSIYANGNVVGGDYIIKDGDSIVIRDDFDIKRVEKPSDPKPAASLMTVFVNGARVVMEGSSHIFVDIFSYIDFDLSKPKGTIKLILNGRNAEYSEKLKDGDNIEVYWESGSQKIIS